LWNIVNADKANVDGFSYSAALAEMDGGWDYQALNTFLYKPKAYVAGTKMNFAGLKKPQDRANIIAYLRSLADAPAALPSEGDIAAETSAQAQ
jgi:cytochrome c